MKGMCRNEMSQYVQELLQKNDLNLSLNIQRQFMQFSLGVPLLVERMVELTKVLEGDQLFSYVQRQVSQFLRRNAPFSGYDRHSNYYSIVPSKDVLRSLNQVPK